MQRALSTHLFVEHRLTTALLDRIRAAGVPLVEIFCGRQHLDYHNKAQIAEIGHYFRDADLTLHSLHAPMFSDDLWGRTGPNAVIDITELTKARRVASVDEIKRALEIAESTPFQYLIQHLGMAGAEFDMHRVDSAFSSLEEISVFARHRGVEVLIENTPNEFSNADGLLRFFEATHLDLNVCFNIGHAHLRGDMDNEYTLLRSRIRSTHIHDNDGKDDQHLFPMAPGGTLDWRRAMGLLNQIRGQYPLMLELKEVAEMGQPLDAVQRSFDQLEGLNSTNEQ